MTDVYNELNNRIKEFVQEGLVGMPGGHGTWNVITDVTQSMINQIPHGSLMGYVENEILTRTKRLLVGLALRQPHVISANITTNMIDYGGFEPACRFKFELKYREVDRMDVTMAAVPVFKFVKSADEIPIDVKKCEFCNGYTYDDRRGNCSACGGPREHIEIKRKVNDDYSTHLNNMSETEYKKLTIGSWNEVNDD